MIVGLVSTWREGSLALSAVRSLLGCCDFVRVLEGPIGQPIDGGLQTDWSEFRDTERVIVGKGEFETDAQKRTELLNRTRDYAAPTWGVVLDGDELLLWGENLREQIEHMEDREAETGIIQTGCSLRLVESDGSVAQINARVLRLDLLEAYVHSSYHLRWRNGTETARPNFPLRLAGDQDMPPHQQVIDELEGQLELVAIREQLRNELGMGYVQRRRPLQGEPHILHRSVLRTETRKAVPRMHVVEHEGLDGAGLGVPVETGEGVRVWTPPTANGEAS